MSTVTENDLKDLKTLIETKFEKVEGKLEKINENINELKVDMSALKAEMTTNNKRLDNTDFIIRSVFVGIIVTISTSILIGVWKILLPLFPNF